MNKFFLALMLTAFSFSLHAQEVQRVTTVIPGKLARSGSSNRQPFSDAALAGLCEQGYTLAIYVYGGARAHDVACSKGKITYMSMTNWEHPDSILSRIGTEFNAGGKVLVHCWYGVHASNMVTSEALIRYCGYSGDQAAAYFKSGVPAGSLPVSRIDQLASEIAGSQKPGSVMQGCPTPK